MVDKKLEGCPRVIQILVFIFNFIFFVFGVTMIGYGAKVVVDTKAYTKLSDVDFLASANLMIAVGVIITIIAFFGCCGACLLNKCLLITFFVLMLIVLICEIAVIGVGYAYGNKVLDELDKGMVKKFKDYNGTDSDLTKAIDTLQEKFKCCGVNNASDWKTSTAFKGTNNVPDSCCQTKKKGCGADNSPIHGKGCFNELKNFFKSNLPVIGGIAIGVVLIQILSLIFSLVLYRQASSSETFA